MKIKILLVDDHVVMRTGLSTLLETQADFQVIDTASDGLETIQKAKDQEPDVILMDINMPHLNGIETTRQLKALYPHVKILTLSVYTKGMIVAQMIQLGASGYIPKNCSAPELFEAIRTVYRNHTYIHPSIQDSVVDYLQKDLGHHKNTLDLLTAREREVLNLVAAGKTTKQIAECLHVSEKTVESHRYQIMYKLQINNLVELVKFAIREGLTPLDTE